VDLLEHQGKAFLQQYGIPVPNGVRATTPRQVGEIAAGLAKAVVVKAQVPVGGRGKLGGVRRAETRDEAVAAAEAMLGGSLKGHPVSEVLVEPASDIAVERYLSVAVDRTRRCYRFLASRQGGVDIEHLASSEPDAIGAVYLAPDELTDPTAPLGEVVSALGPDSALEAQALAAAASAGLRALIEGDAELVEINPLATRRDGSVVALDAKVTLDDAARFRHPEWAQWAAGGPADSIENRARAAGLAYVALGGSVGVVANGAGLAMATVDLIAESGGAAANFLDIGGGASAEVMATALSLVIEDPNVRSILVNVFGGITRCDEVARGILAAAARLGRTPPTVVRLAGTEAPAGLGILAGAPAEWLIGSESMDDAAATAVALAR
jgi:succinyl-CoA synthetase beta subunit